LIQLARPAGFEPTTPWFVARYSIQLSYGREVGHYSKAARPLKAREGAAAGNNDMQIPGAETEVRDVLPSPEVEVRMDRVRLLFHQSLPATAISLAAASLLAAMLWPAADHGRVTAWLAALAVASVARLGLFVRYRRREPTGPRLLAWEKPYAASLLASAFIWGIGSAWIMPRDSFLHQTIALVILVGMAGGALSVYSAVRWLTIATVTLILLPATIVVLLTEERTAMFLGIGVLLFLVSALRATRVLSTTLRENFELAHALRRAKEEAERLANTDALTGLTNRRAFLDRAEAPFHYCRRNGLSVAAVVLDLDHFKHINDTKGHAVGDLALQHVARLIQSNVRKSDLCCRWGGEEFVLLLPDASLEEAVDVARKLRAVFVETPVPLKSGALPITASFGVAAGHRDLEWLIDRADAAMYRAKHEGRDRVVVDGLGEPTISRMPG
jgi:diguanylate cyclase (GGDEF)-like protein